MEHKSHAISYFGNRHQSNSRSSTFRDGAIGACAREIGAHYLAFQNKPISKKKGHFREPLFSVSKQSVL